MTDTSVKYFHSGMAGAPMLSGTSGALIGVLDACLVNGWNLLTADSLMINANVATFNRAAGVSYEVDQVVVIAGATVSGGSINGEQRLIAVSSTSCSFATTGLANQTATGTITAKVAPATWLKSYSGTNKAVYKSSDITATGCLLRVDDSVTNVARVVGYETMSDVDTGMGPFPTSAQRSGGLYWTKSNASDSTARPWILIADSKTFYFCREYHVSHVGRAEVTAFGDVNAVKSGDAWACILSGITANQATNGPSNSDQYHYNSAADVGGLYAPRAHTGLGSAIPMSKTFSTLVSTNVRGSSGAVENAPIYPNASDGGLYVSPHLVLDNATATLRGLSPGIWCCPMRVPAGSFTSRDKVTGVTGLNGKKLLTVTIFGDGSTYANSPVFFDITGPWR